MTSPPAATVVGAGPGGLMAAEVLAAAGLRVTVYDHMPSAGRKLLLAGRGGLNLTHGEPLTDLLARYGPATDRLEAAIRRFDPAALRAWAAELGVPTVVGTSGRVFPASFRATPLLRVWLRRLDGAGVTMAMRHRWVGWAEDDEGRPDPRRSRFAIGPEAARDPEAAREIEVAADVTVFALGGASWPRVGSTGSWVDAFRRAGVDVQPFRPANGGVRVDWTRTFVDRCAGQPLKNVAIRVDTGDGTAPPSTAVRGDAIVTATGLEGGPIYALTVPIREALDAGGSCRLLVDLHPDRSEADLADRWARRRAKDSVATALRRALGLPAPSAGLVLEAGRGHLPADPHDAAALVKGVPVAVMAAMPIDRAISSAGGVDLAEVDESFMLRRLPGTYVVGEMLDWEAPTGGYLLQATFSTAVSAADGAVARLAHLAHGG